MAPTASDAHSPGPRPPTSLTGEPHPSDGLVRDPAGLPALCDEHDFAALLHEMVADQAPRLFAVVQEYGRRVDGCIAAWGMDFPDHADVVAVDGGARLSLPSAQSAVRAFHVGTHVRAHLVWVTMSER